MWLCRCDCGNECIAGSYELRNGLKKSCGCLMTEWLHSPHLTHGMASSRLYSIWRSMRDRCERPGNTQYANYGGRGIAVCPEWQASFEAFAEWAVQNGYREDLTIDRKDVCGNYCPENCRWATRLEQSRNRRCARFLTYQGEMRPLWEWAELTGIPFNLISSRMARGWPAERIFREPIHTECKNHRSKNK